VETFWFWALAGLLTVYVVLDGFDLGAGVVSLLVARTEEERRDIARSIGPFWDGNEVWLVAAGGTLFVAFPVLYATALSGFYLPLMIVLWLFILRAVGLEFSHRVSDSLWSAFWDHVFAWASLLLAFFLGVALGNVVRGVPFDGNGDFFEPLWTSFLPWGRTGVLDTYTVVTGLTATAAVTVQGAAWVAWRTQGGLAARAGRTARRALWATGVLTILLTLYTMRVQPQVPARMLGAPAGLVFPALALTGWILAARARPGKNPRRAFLGSSLYLAGMLASVAFGLYPYVLPSVGEPGAALTVTSASAPGSALRLAMGWWIPGILLASSYTVFVYRRLWKHATDEEGGY